MYNFKLVQVSIISSLSYNQLQFWHINTYLCLSITNKKTSISG